MNDGLYLASRRRRLAATAVDAICVPTLTLLLVLMTGILEDAQDYVSNLWMVQLLGLAIASYLLLNGYGLWHRGQTLGKRAFGIAIVSQSTNVAGQGPAPFWKLVCVRALFFPLMFTLVVPTILILPLLDLVLIFFPARRCLHDFVAGTRVVRR
ncbi:MAG: hypothetical protein HN856_15565 [Gammaproteobacteria bacterium]|jgi:uncharacterized RDD family membrane protein YckC|nr:hypothetical protein [Gammaproteobacteria bacterium]